MGSEKIVILGGRGMLGADLTNLGRIKKMNFTSVDLPEFDITDRQQIREGIRGASFVINCAAYTNVEKAEQEREAAFAVNAEAVGRLGEAAKEVGIKVIHISTDFVFDGTKQGPYNEEDEPNPINVYGQSKLAGERLLIESGCQYCIIRLQWTYGLNGNNFIKKLITAAKEKKELKVVDDQVGTPTATEEASKVIFEMVEKKARGLYHFASDGFVSRFEMARFIFSELKMPVTLNACKTRDFPSAAVRPLNSRFDCGKIQAVLDKPIEGWQGPLKRFLKELKKREMTGI